MSFIKLDRKIIESEVFAHEGHLRFWLWLLIRANYKDSFVPINIGTGKSTVKVNRGSFVFGRKSASESLGVKAITLYSWLQKFKELGMIELESNNHYTLVTICKYEDYQSVDNNEITTEYTPTIHQLSTEYTPNNTDKNIKEVKEIKEIDMSDKPTTRKFIPPTVDEVKTYCTERKNKISPQKFIDHYEAVSWMRGKNKIKDWKAAVRTWEQNGINSNVEDKIFFDEEKSKEVVSAIEKMSAVEWQTHMNVFRVNIESKMIYCESKKKYVTWSMLENSQRLFDRAKREYESKGLGSTYLTPATYGKR